jgi:hypothetical protein
MTPQQDTAATTAMLPGAKSTKEEMFGHPRITRSESSIGGTAKIARPKPLGLERFALSLQHM